MTHKIKNTLTRLCSVSLRRMFMCVAAVAEQSKKGKVRIVFDMFYCYLRYGIGYLDYLTFGFIYQTGAGRRTFMTMNKNLEFVRLLNPKDKRSMLDDKLLFNRLFANCLGREFIDLRDAEEQGFRQFAKKRRHIFAKCLDGYGGKGIERLEVAAIGDYRELFAKLMAAGQYLIEGEITQHPEMTALAPSSVNSLRMVTLAVRGEVHLLYTLLRVSDGENFVDNISSGGMYCPVGDDGVVGAEAFQDETGRYYDRHPKTDMPFIGFVVPFYNEAVQLVKKAAGMVGPLRYIGWDIAITRDRPVLIEGNVIPGYDMCQNYRHLFGGKHGILPRFIELLDGDIPSAPC